MSSDIHPDVPLRIRCEAISPDTSSITACHRPHRSMLRLVSKRTSARSPRLRDPACKPSADCSADCVADDPSVLIGLALGHVRQGAGLTGIVPEAIVSRLRSHAGHDNPACRLLLDWLVHRNRDLLSGDSEAGAGQAGAVDDDRPEAIVSVVAAPSSRRGSIRARVLEALRQSEPDDLPLRKRRRHRPRDGKTAIIAATTEGRIDG